jgi:hypothetical protein
VLVVATAALRLGGHDITSPAKPGYSVSKLGRGGGARGPLIVAWKLLHNNSSKGPQDSPSLGRVLQDSHLLGGGGLPGRGTHSGGGRRTPCAARVESVSSSGGISARLTSPDLAAAAQLLEATAGRQCQQQRAAAPLVVGLRCNID